MTRIVAGRAKGRSLAVPAAGTRPTTARIREALFSKLNHWNMMDEARVLDLYAGSGALGLEALSQGAAHCVFVDNAKPAMDVVRANAKATGLAGQANFYLGDAATYLERARGGESSLWVGDTADVDTFDLVFVDPPYAFTETQITAIASALAPYLNETSVIVIERSHRAPEPQLPDGLEVFDHRRWGDTTCWFVQLVEAEPPID